MDMQQVFDYRLSPDEAVLWWLGQAGYLIRTDSLTIVIDPYLSDAAATGMPEFSRRYPPPLLPEQVYADLYLITHNHADHLDPETVQRYQHQETTRFVAPRLAAKQLEALGVPARNILRLDAGEQWGDTTVELTAVFALPTGVDVLDTTGYLIRFANGRSVYHTSDTQYHPLVLAAAPKQPEVMLVPINGKWGNPSAQQAAEFAAYVQPGAVLPNHYDVMALNTENPESFRWFCGQNGLADACVIVSPMQPICWNGHGHTLLDKKTTSICIGK